MMGGDWFHFAASVSSVEMLEFLIEDGFDAHSVADYEGDNALANAASAGNVENVAFLLKLGLRMDTSTSHRNPLFRAINAAMGRLGGGFPEVKGNPNDVIKLLLAEGIDPWVEYGSDEENKINAGGYAIMYGRPEIAELIVDIISEDNEAARAEYLDKAKSDAEKF